MTASPGVFLAPLKGSLGSAHKRRTPPEKVSPGGWFGIQQKQMGLPQQQKLSMLHRQK